MHCKENKFISWAEFDCCRPRDSTRKEMVVLDSREVAPQAADKDMFKNVTTPQPFRGEIPQAQTRISCKRYGHVSLIGTITEVCCVLFNTRGLVGGCAWGDLRHVHSVEEVRPAALEGAAGAFDSDRAGRNKSRSSDQEIFGRSRRPNTSRTQFEVRANKAMVLHCLVTNHCPE